MFILFWNYLTKKTDELTILFASTERFALNTQITNQSK